MTKHDLHHLLNTFRQLPAETEWLEFKAAKNNFHFDSLGKYFSALSNEANLKNKTAGWLIFGINDKTKAIEGSNYRPNRANLDSLKSEIANHTNGRITFIEIHELQLPEGRVILFEIPAAPKGIPVSWKGHYYGRDDEQLQALNIHEIEAIRNQAKNYDWSAQVVSDASLEDLEQDAIDFARQQYIKKYGDEPEINTWDDLTFLNKAHITKQGKITNTAILLLGKPESKHFIEPAHPLITWVVRNERNEEMGYEHFHLPFILVSDKLYSRIRNLKYVYIQDHTLFPTEIDMYDPFLIRESLHNCMAHQDYEEGRRINVIEHPSELVLTNAGSFIPESIENVIELDAPPDKYRNPFLATAMTNLNMIEIRGGGIRKMFDVQRKRFFPMPDYDLSKYNTVKVKIFGKILDEKYTKLLKKRTDLDLKTVVLLDLVQKNKGTLLSSEQISYLRREQLIEGRKPNFYVAARVAKLTGETAEYIKNRGIEDAYIKKMIIDYLEINGATKRGNIEAILLPKLSNILTISQKKNKIQNILQALRKDEKIKVNGKVWELA